MLGWSWPTDTRVDYSAPPSSPKHLPSSSSSSSSQGFVTTKKLSPLTFLAISIWEYHLLQKITAPLVTGVPGVVTSESHVGVLFSRQPSGGLFSPLYRRSHPIFWPPVILISSQLRGGHHRIWLYLIIFTVNFRFSSINNCSTTVAEIRLLRLFENYSMYPKLCHVSKASSIFILTQLQCSEPYGLALICYERPLSQLPNTKFSQRWEILRILFLENIFPK